ncbi:IS3 family transposase [Vagococcus entomophilus]|uniref:IS3 family transposase n=1 Tax=Vagococcus entomophilus TaxID=1160095 RepID=UPI0035E8E7FF
MVFFNSRHKEIEREELNHPTFSSLKEVKLACFEYIEVCHNPKRPVSAIDRLSPNLKEEI